jgi:hypothetical protein
MGEMRRAIAHEQDERRTQDRFVSTLVIAASIIAVRLARDDISAATEHGSEQRVTAEDYSETGDWELSVLRIARRLQIGCTFVRCILAQRPL